MKKIYNLIIILSLVFGINFYTNLLSMEENSTTENETEEISIEEATEETPTESTEIAEETTEESAEKATPEETITETPDDTEIKTEELTETAIEMPTENAVPTEQAETETEEPMEEEPAIETIEETPAPEEKVSVEQSQPAAKPTPPVEFEQPKWPKALEISEQTTSAKPVTKEVKNLAQKVNTIFKEIKNKRKELYNTFYDIDSQLDILFQQTSFKKGEFQKKLTLLKAEQNKELTTDLENYKQNWDNIVKQINQIDELENKILKQLKMLDQEIDDAASINITVRKLKIKSMQTAKEEKHDNIATGIKTELTKIEKIKDNVNKIASSLEKEFNNIKSQIKTTQNQTEKLQKQAIDLGIQKEPSPKKEIIAPPVKKEKSNLFKQSVNVVAGTITFINKAKDWVVSVFKSASEKSKESENQKVAEEEKSDLENIETKISNLQEKMEKLIAEKEKITDQQKLLSQKQEKRRKKIVKSEEQIKQIEEVKISQKENLEKSKIRKEAEVLFSKTLDAIGWGINKVKKYSRNFYEKVIKKNTTKFISSVKKRVNELEKLDELKEEEKQEEPAPAEIVSEETNVQEAAEMAPTEKEEQGAPPVL